MKKSIIYIFTALVLATSISGCLLNKEIKDGKTAYEAKQYAIAVPLLEEEYRKTNNDIDQAKVATQLGLSYSFLEQMDQSVSWFEKALTKDESADTKLQLAKAYKKIGKYKAALGMYESLLNEVSNRQLIEREIFVLKSVSKWAKEKDLAYQIENLPQNSSFSEYGGVVIDKNLLVFTSDRKEATGSETYSWTGNSHTDIFVMLKSGSEAKRFDATINSKHNEGMACFTQSGEEVVFTRCFSDDESDGTCKLFYSSNFEGVWSEPIVLPFFSSVYANFGQSTFIENDSVLIFSAEKEDGIDKHDLYYSERIFDEQGSFVWSEPYKMPPTINSSGREMFPVGDGDTLYYSSDYYEGLGGLDIFKTWLKPNGQWAPPENLKSPINSSYDDFGYFVDRNANLRGSEIQKGFFTSTRSGFGKEDIFKFTKSRLEEKTDIEVDDTPKPKIEIYLAGYTKEYAYNNPEDPNSGKIGTVSLPDCKIIFSDGDTSQLISSSDEARFISTLMKDKTYTIRAEKKGYLSDSKSISTKDLKIKEGELSKTVNVTLTLTKIFEDVEINLDNIYYNFNKWDIRDDAKPTLDSLYYLLSNNQDVNIQLSSHTDCRGDLEYNRILSHKRAESAVNYLTQKGIERTRMTAKGYGASALAINCNCDDCTEAEHQTNRRTTFKILGQ